MIDTTTLIAYVAIVLGFVFIPGPATLLTITRAASSGTRVGIATGAGIAAGDAVHTFMAIVGISAIIAASAMLFSIVKYIGAAYLVYLGIRAILSKHRLISHPVNCRFRPARRFVRPFWPKCSIPRRRCSFSRFSRNSSGRRMDRWRSN